MVTDEPDGRLVGIVNRLDLLSVYTRRDAEIQRDIIAEVITGQSGVDQQRFSVLVEDGEVTLQGHCERPDADQPTAQRGTTNRGVVSARSQLEYDIDDRYPSRDQPAAQPILTRPDAPVIFIIAVGGLAGVGKTELAGQAARAALGRGWFPGGVLFVDLFGYDPARRLEPGQALGGFLRALGVPGEHIPSGAQDRTRLYTSILAAYERQGRRILVVIDNASARDQVEPLLSGAGGTAVIITSRHTLGMLGARLLDLDVLDREGAISILREELQVARPGDTRVTDHSEDAARLAELCGGLPLALKIVAALLAENPSRSPAAVVGDLADAGTRLEEMRYADTAVRTAFDLSYRHLIPDQARLFRPLTVNPGPEISTAATAAMSGLADAEARLGLEALARANLIEHGSAEARWRMHDLVRLYAEQQGGTNAEVDGRSHAHAQLVSHYLTTTRAAVGHLDPTVQDPGRRGCTGRGRRTASPPRDRRRRP